MNLRQGLISALYWSSMAIGCILSVIVYIFTLPGSGGTRRIIGIFIVNFPTLIMKLTGLWEVEFIDHRKEKDDYRGVYVIVSNHKSVIDSVLTPALPYDSVFTMNKKWRFAPVIGQISYAANFIMIDPKDAVSRNQAI